MSNYCLTCRKEHEPTPEHPNCFSCFGLHADDKDGVIEFKGWKFTAPFFCFCCGAKICGHQWAFSRSCGGCDVGRCKHPYNQHRQKIYSGPRELCDENDPHFLQPDRFIDITQEPEELLEWKKRVNTPILKFPNRPIFPRPVKKVFKRPCSPPDYRPKVT